VRTWAGFTYVAFIVDVYAQRIVAWHAATTKQTDLHRHQRRAAPRGGLCRTPRHRVHPHRGFRGGHPLGHTCVLTPSADV
jgi:hypothetical protein